MKPEYRSPKAERRPKTESRNATQDAQTTLISGSRDELCRDQARHTLRIYAWRIVFGFLPSDFGLLSTFGIRASDFAS